MVSSSSERSSKRRSSRFSSRKRVLDVQNTHRPTPPRLALDTSFTRHHDCLLRQTFASESKSIPVASPIHQSSNANAGSTPHAVTRLRTLHQHARKLKPSPLELHASSQCLKPVGPSKGYSPSNISDPMTPSIMVTPANEDHQGFQIASTGRPRAPSSVYSRYTDFNQETSFIAQDAPPVPPVPSHLQLKSAGTTVSASLQPAKGRVATVSVCTVFEEDQSPKELLTKQSPNDLPSASSQRSKGWWNFVTSPFSARSNAFVWRSPLSADEERTPILSDVQETSRADVTSYATSQSTNPAQSMNETAGSINSSDTIDIYRIPSQGEAAPYYDLARRFPSLILDDAYDSSTQRDLGISIGNDTSLQQCLQVNTKEHASKQIKGRVMFMTPQAEELATPAAFYIVQNAAQKTHMSPLSPSPVVEDARLAQAAGPNTLHGERREVSVTASCTPSPSPSPPIRHGLAAATMASRQVIAVPGEASDARSLHQETSYRSFNHRRHSSYGLGIYGSESNVSHPTVAVLVEKGSSIGTIAAMPRSWYRRFLWLILMSIAVFIGVLITLLVIFIPQKHQDMSLQGQWVNLTGFPALPVGVMTVIQPKNVRSESGCVAHKELWTCQAPTGQSSQGSASKDMLPSFRLEIRFRNDSSFNSSMLQTHQRKRSIGRPSNALMVRDFWSTMLYEPSPSPPSIADQIFLGNTTDNTTEPFEGDSTPFFISLLDPTDLRGGQSLLRRDQQPYPMPDAGDAATSSSPSSSHVVPKMSMGSDGKPVPQVLYPFASAQPIRLFKRGKPDEHYGFYAYYDRSIYLASNQTGPAGTGVVCAWSQTRFLVQIWTHSLLPRAQNTSSSILRSGSERDGAVTAINSTANEMTAPGSFPYPVTLTIDRHGGDGVRKGVYCNGLNANGKIEQSSGTWVDENRGFRGRLVNAAAIPGGNSSAVQNGDNGQTGIDGGTGGCACAFQNW